VILLLLDPKLSPSDQAGRLFQSHQKMCKVQQEETFFKDKITKLEQIGCRDPIATTEISCLLTVETIKANIVATFRRLYSDKLHNVGRLYPIAFPDKKEKMIQ
jgi:hypothetical protein